MQAFGETTPNSTNLITMNLRYPGQYFDAETGTHYNYFRDYNPRVGRYSQSDPIGLSGGINHYGYAGGNGLRYRDPKGLRVLIRPAPVVVPINGNGAYTNQWEDPTNALPFGQPVEYEWGGEKLVLVWLNLQVWVWNNTWGQIFSSDSSENTNDCGSNTTASGCSGSIVVSETIIYEKRKAGRWSCTAKCQIKVIDPILDGRVPGYIGGFGQGKTESDACSAAKRDATQSVPLGTHARHCRCICSGR